MTDYKTLTPSRNIQIAGTDLFNRIINAVFDNLKLHHPNIVRKLRREHLVVQQTELSDVHTYTHTFKLGSKQHVQIDFGRLVFQAGEDYDSTDALIGALIEQISRIIMGHSRQKSDPELNAAVDHLVIRLGFVSELAELRRLQSERLYVSDDD